MTVKRNIEYLTSLVSELRKSASETEWIEFKHNNIEPDVIGEQISALANSAALCGKANAYLVWGIDDKSHDILGTSFSPLSVKIGNEELESWLLKLLDPKIHFRFFELIIEDKPVVLLEIGRAFRHPVQFKKSEFIRVGSYKKKLKDFPEKERKLWRIFDDIPFEELIAAENVPSDEVLKLLDYPAYFDLLEQPLPESRDQILEALKSDAMISRSDTNQWNILNLGAILLSKKLDDFKLLKRKSVRVILYRDNSRNETIREQESTKGYASCFEELIGLVNTLLPVNEVVERALRKNVPMYPDLAVRELVANAIIHQDFFITGTGPMIEIFQNRIEITNPGKPLIDTARFLDSPPRSRNEILASFLRRVGVCEERGSGVDKVVRQTELHQLPAPVFETYDESTRIVLFAHLPMRKIDKDDRVRACYLHACLKYVEREYMTNSSLRERFGIESKNSAIASRIIKEAHEAGLIRLYDPDVSRRYAKYVPFWVKR